jgi:aminoglycoside phosphotransferase family enzyme/predicted kinase
VDHVILVDALRNAAFYPHPVDTIEYIQTHISSVFLTGDYAYKLKKPVDFGFLDFSTPELRRRFCEAEVELNRRLAPAVYLRVEPITLSEGRPTLGGTGEAVDWLVVMRQMDTERLGPNVLARGELDERLIDQVVEQLVPFYSNAATGSGVDRYGTVEGVKINTDENFEQTAEYVGTALSRRRYDGIRGYTDAFYRDRSDLFERRITEGRIRESHGDLHLGNIFFEDEPVIFDCIEFNERFRCGDVAVDLAFLAMDLDFRGRPELAQRLIDGYVECSGDHELRELMDFYRCYRAYVRGKIACFTSSDPGLTEEARNEHTDLARRYFQLAHRYAGGSSRPTLLVVFGLVGTGKTSVAEKLEQAYGWHLVSSDDVRKRLTGVGVDRRVYVPYEAGIYSPEMSRKTYDEMCNQAESLLTADLPVVVDGCFKRKSERVAVIETAERVGADVVFLQTTCEPDEQRRRLDERQQTETKSDGRVELIEPQLRDFDPPSPEHAHLFHTLPTGTSHEEAYARLDAFLRSRGLLE